MHNLPNSIAAIAASNIPINFHMFLMANCGEILRFLFYMNLTVISLNVMMKGRYSSFSGGICFVFSEWILEPSFQNNGAASVTTVSHCL